MTKSFHREKRVTTALLLAAGIGSRLYPLTESDLVYEKSLLSAMLYPNRIAIAKMQPWMNGTYVTVNQSGRVKSIMVGHDDFDVEKRYKTVNIYSISLPSWRRIVDKLDQQIAGGNVNEYYEIVFAQMIAEGSLSLDIVSFDGKAWYEIDNLADLAQAEKIFSRIEENATAAMLSPPGAQNRKKINVARSDLKRSEVIDVANRLQ